MMKQIADPRSEIEELSRVVTEALRQTKTGLAANLSDLETRANRICEYLLALPALEARPYAAKLEHIIDGMNTLEDAIASEFGAFAANVDPDQPATHAAK
jgi:hypothetical protein